MNDYVEGGSTVKERNNGSSTYCVSFGIDNHFADQRFELRATFSKPSTKVLNSFGNLSSAPICGKAKASGSLDEILGSCPVSFLAA